MILFCSSDPTGNCFIETGALDGEKNLKPKNALNDTQKYFEEYNSKDNEN